MYERKNITSNQAKGNQRDRIRTAVSKRGSQTLNVNGETVRSWLSIYRSEGMEGLSGSSKNRIYSVQTKQKAVETYLTGQYSLQKICEIFKIRSKSSC